MLVVETEDVDLVGPLVPAFPQITPALYAKLPKVFITKLLKIRLPFIHQGKRFDRDEDIDDGL